MRRDQVCARCAQYADAENNADKENDRRSVGHASKTPPVVPSSTPEAEYIAAANWAKDNRSLNAIVFHCDRDVWGKREGP